MIRAGLTGGYATGKSFVAAEFAQLGCHVISADALGHSVLEPGGAAFPLVVERFGESILESGRIDRKKLGALVFPHPDLLAELEAIVHPAVARLESELTAAFAATDPSGILIYEAAILIETGRSKEYQPLILTTATPEIQLQRGIERDHLAPEQIRARIARQLSDDEKRRYADFVIDTSGTKEETKRQVHQILMQLKAESQPA